MVVKGSEMESSETIVFLVVNVTEWWETGQQETKSSNVAPGDSEWGEWVSV